MRARGSTRRTHLGHSLTDCSSRKSATTNARPGSKTPAINQTVALQPLSLAALAVAAARTSTKITASKTYPVSGVMASSANDNRQSRRDGSVVEKDVSGGEKLITLSGGRQSTTVEYFRRRFLPGRVIRFPLITKQLSTGKRVSAVRCRWKRLLDFVLLRRFFVRRNR